MAILDFGRVYCVESPAPPRERAFLCGLGSPDVCSPTYCAASTVSLRPIALVTATRVDSPGVAVHRQCSVKTLAFDAGSLGNFSDALSLGEVAQGN